MGCTVFAARWECVSRITTSSQENIEERMVTVFGAEQKPKGYNQHPVPETDPKPVTKPTPAPTPKPRPKPPGGGN